MKNPEEACMRVQQRSATDTLQVQHYTLRLRQTLRQTFSPTFHCAKELLGAGHWPTRRGWTFCPARAGPFWIKRGVCSLHDLEEVWKQGGKNYQLREKPKKTPAVSASAKT
jgi:hypothetical protein